MSASNAPAAPILAGLKRAGIDLVVSLPDQWLGDLIGRCQEDPAITHVRLAREDDGVGICAGAFLGGRKAALVCQNAGVLLSVNALAGLAFHHQIPMLILAAHRGCFDDGYYYQMYKGWATERVLEGIGLPYTSSMDRISSNSSSREHAKPSSAAFRWSCCCGGMLCFRLQEPPYDPVSLR